MNVAQTRRFVTATPEPEAKVIAPQRVQQLRRHQRKATAKSNSQNTDRTDYADNNTDKQTAIFCLSVLVLSGLCHPCSGFCF